MRDEKPGENTADSRLHKFTDLKAKMRMSLMGAIYFTSYYYIFCERRTKVNISEYCEFIKETVCKMNLHRIHDLRL